MMYIDIRKKGLKALIVDLKPYPSITVCLNLNSIILLANCKLKMLSKSCGDRQLWLTSTFPPDVPVMLHDYNLSII